MVPKDNWQINPSDAAFITIDYQQASLPGAPLEIPGLGEQIIKVNELAEICRQLGIPIIHIRMVVRDDLSDIGLLQQIRPRTDSDLEYREGDRGAGFFDDSEVRLDVREGDYDVKKVRYSALIPGSSNLEPLLRGLGRNSLIVCGGATDVCLGTTVSCAMMLGFKVFLVGDLTFTLSEERQRIALEVLDRHFAKVMNSEEVKKELRQSSVGVR